jgi:hypothetical protein
MGKLAPPTLLASLSLGAVLAAGVVAPASAAVVDVVWNFNVRSGALGPSESYTSMGYTITASGFTGAWAPVDLYGKNAGGAENGLGLVNDPSGQHEITAGSWVQIAVSALPASKVLSLDFEAGSTSGGEAWTMYGSDSTGVGAVLTPILSGTDGLTSHTLPTGFTYYDFAYTGPTKPGVSNVLLHDFSASISSIPEPSSWVLMALGFGGLGFVAFRRGRRARAIAL